MSELCEAHKLQAPCHWCEFEQLQAENAALKTEVLNWTETAAQHCRNEFFYSGLLDQCATHLGPQVYVSDDGSVQGSPLRLKVPELVAAMKAELEAANKHCEILNAHIERLGGELAQLHTAVKTQAYPSGDFLSYWELAHDLMQLCNERDKLNAELAQLREASDKLLRAVMLRDGDTLEAAANVASLLLPSQDSEQEQPND